MHQGTKVEIEHADLNETMMRADKNSTIVFPLPMDIVAPLIDALKRQPPAAA